LDVQVDDLDHVRILAVDASLRVLGARRDIREFGSSSVMEWEGEYSPSESVLAPRAGRGGGEREVFPSGSK
jgi:hypothetical protein